MSVGSCVFLVVRRDLYVAEFRELSTLYWFGIYLLVSVRFVQVYAIGSVSRSSLAKLLLDHDDEYK